MNWLFFALLAPAVYALVVFIDKYIVSKEVKDYLCMPLYASVVGFFFGTIAWFLAGRPLLPFYDAILTLGAGILTIISFVMYYHALLLEDASNINLFFQMGPMFIFILAFLFLREKLNARQIIGFVIIFYAVYHASLLHGRKGQPVHTSKALIYIFIYDILWALSAILMKLALKVNTFSQIISYQNWGVALGGIGIYFLVPSMHQSFIKSLCIIKKRFIGIMMLNEFLFVLARSVTYLAYSLGLVAIVGVLEGTQVFYGLFYGWSLTKLLPKSFNENITRTTLRRKVFLAGILFAGIFLIY